VCVNEVLKYVQVKKRIINEHLLPLLTYADICAGEENHQRAPPAAADVC